MAGGLVQRDKAARRPRAPHLGRVPPLPAPEAALAPLAGAPTRVLALVAGPGLALPPDQPRRDARLVVKPACQGRVRRSSRCQPVIATSHVVADLSDLLRFWLERILDRYLHPRAPFGVCIRRACQ